MLIDQFKVCEFRGTWRYYIYADGHAIANGHAKGEKRALLKGLIRWALLRRKHA